MRGSLSIDIRTPLGQADSVKFSRSGLMKKTKNQLVSTMFYLDLTVPKHLEDSTKADLMEMIWGRVVHRAREFSCIDCADEDPGLDGFCTFLMPDKEFNLECNHPERQSC